MLLTITELQPFLKQFFSSQNCELIHEEDGLITVQLTEEMDKHLMNRPFFWHYIKSTSQTATPMKLTLITHPEKKNKEGEWIHFGSPRLQQIFNHLKEEKKVTQLFQQINTSVNTPLYPWLLLNMKINYKGRQNKEEIFSIGLQLVSGEMRVKMMQLLEGVSLNRSISDYCYPISPLIKYKSGYMRVMNVLYDYVYEQPHAWAQDSLQCLDEEVQLIEHFYQGINEEKQKEKEIQEITNRYTPSITFSIINGGIIYLREDF